MERKTEFIIIRVTKTLKSKLVKGAKDLGISFSSYIREILNEK